MDKTCWYTTIHPLRVGELIGSRGSADLRPMVRFGLALGAAFQIRDDLLNLTGDAARHGKEVCSDLYEGKRTLMLIHPVAEAGGAHRIAVTDYLTTAPGRRTADQVRRIRGLMDKYGSIGFATGFGQGLAREAALAFDEAFGQATAGPDADFVRGLIPYLLGRQS
jgi:geranylgeranyl diphosphate synthase type II